MTCNILHLIDSSGFYGAERVIVTLCQSLPHSSFSSFLGSFMIPQGMTPEINIIANNLGLKVVPIIQAYKFDWHQLKHIINEHKIDIIHCHGYKPSLLSFIAQEFSGKNMIITCHLWTNATLRLKIYALIESLIMRRVQYVVAVSNDIKNIISESGVKEENLKVILNGIDINKWQADASLDYANYRMILGLREDSLLIGLFGRLYSQKGHKYLFQALSRLKNKNIELLCVGDGPLEKELRELSGKLGIDDSIHFLGFRNDIKELLQLTDLVVMPSLDEGLPMAMLEAMAMEKPVIASSVGAIPDVIMHNRDGIIIPSRSIDDLAAAIITLQDNEHMRKLLGRNARLKVIKEYSSSIMARQYCELYEAMYHAAN
ncbi:MAG: glycosyltransferase family 4 protein [Desulfobulbaceae bacterium]|nr:glycosyltransferase family 4 protein [Desulfobulbaceae bacterium]